MIRLGGIIIGIGGRHLRANPFAPGVQPCLQFRNLLRTGSGEIARLTDVVLEVVKLHAPVFIELDQPEVAGADRAVRGGPAGMVVRIVPVDRVTRQRTALLQKRHEAFAVHDMPGRLRHAGHR